MTALDLERTANFPQCLGVFDGKHIRVIKPEESGSMLFNYKDFSFCGINSHGRYQLPLCVYVDVGSYGKDCDSTVFRRSTLWTSMQTIVLELTSERPLSGTEGPTVPHLFVRDKGFALNRITLQPFGGSNLSFKNECTNIACAKHEAIWNVALEF